VGRSLAGLAGPTQLGRVTSLRRILLTVLLSAPCSLAAQSRDDGVVLRGRIEDAETRGAIEGVRVVSADSTAIAVTDSLGNFELVTSAPGPWVIHADRFGYVTERFDLAGDAQRSRYVLLLEPAPIALETLTVEAEAALVQLVRNLGTRRNAYPHAMRALDRPWIDRFGPVGGSALDLVVQAAPRLFECTRDASQLCTRGRSVTFRNPYPEDRVVVCIDDLQSLSPTNELAGIDVASVALVEIYQRVQVRVYSTRWLISQAERGWTTVMPFLPIPGC
jgi:hypothetical protein